jgi:hypothetical protein
MTRKAWRSNGHTPPSLLADMTRPEECVSVDQLESPHPGLIAQMKGTPTRERFTAATAFVNHLSGYTFVSLQRSTNAVETVQANRDFERQARSMGVTISRYHSDNGRFAESAW